MSKMAEVNPEDNISIMVNPMPVITVIEARTTIGSQGGTESPTGTDSPGILLSKNLSNFWGLRNFVIVVAFD